MVLENVNNVIDDLEENAKKIGSVTKSVEDFKKIITDLEKLPKDIEEKGNDYLDQIKNKHASLSKDLTEILKNLEKLEKSIPESLDKGNQKLVDASRVINEIPAKVKDLELSISNYQNIIKDTTINEANSIKTDIRDLKVELSDLSREFDSKTKKLGDAINWAILLSLIAAALLAATQFGILT